MPPRKNFMGSGLSAQEQQARRQSVEALFEPRLAQRRVVSQDIPIARILPNPFQARTTFDAGEIAELAQAIRELGFTSRLRVRPHAEQEGYFQLVYGERRLRAAAQAGLETVPCDVAEHTDDDLVEIGLAENIQRRDLDPIEEATAFQSFIDQRGYSIRRLAERLGKDRGYVEGRLALLRVPDDVKALVAQRPDTLDAARQIARLPAEERQPLISALTDGTLTSREVRAFVRSLQTAVSAVPTATDTAQLPQEEEQSVSPALSAPSATSQTRSAHATGAASMETSALSPSHRPIVPPTAASGAPQPPDPELALVQSVRRDQQTISAILKRWKTIRTSSANKHAIIDEVLETLLKQLSSMLNQTGVD